MKHYKFLTDKNTGGYSSFVYPIPNGKPTKWLKCEGQLWMCCRGFHVTVSNYLSWWIENNLYEAEIRGERIEKEDKICSREIRLIKKLEGWNERTQRLFAADCAERVLHVFEKKYPDDDRLRKAIQAARDFANGKISKEELDMAANNAEDAIVDIVNANTSYAHRAACCAANSVAYTIAGDAANAANAAVSAILNITAGDAADEPETLWQSKRLLDYAEGGI